MIDGDDHLPHPDPARPRGRRAEARRRARSRRRRRAWTVLATLIVLAVVAGAAYVGRGLLAEDPEPIVVRVQAEGVDARIGVDDGDPVSLALSLAGVGARDGRLLSAGDGKVLDPRLDPAQITVNDDAANPATALIDGAVINVVDGVDQVEATEVVVEDLPEAPLPDVLRHIHERGRPGRAEQVVGTVSGEVVSRRILEEPVDPVQTTQRTVALTFDDGPTEAWTPEVLRILDERGVKATFCQVGENVARRTELVQQVVAAGHQLCNHTLNHDEGLRDAPQDQLDRQIGGGRQAFVDAGFPAPRYYRPPGGFLSDAITATARAQGEPQILWKVDTEDWKRDANVLTIIDKVLTQVDDGAIILLHDGGGSTRQATVDALPFIIELLRQQSYSFTFPVIDPTPAG